MGLCQTRAPVETGIPDRPSRLSKPELLCGWRTRMDIAKRELGRTGLQVTTLGYGAMELRGAPRARDISEAQAETILNKVLDAAINYIDTSVDYGMSEERIGRYISHRRAEYYLASKCGCLVGAPPPAGYYLFTRLVPVHKRTFFRGAEGRR